MDKHAHRHDRTLHQSNRSLSARRCADKVSTVDCGWGWPVLRYLALWAVGLITSSADSRPCVSTAT